MISHLRSYLQSPQFDDEDQTRIARTLHTLLMVISLGAMIYLPFAWFFTPIASGRWLIALVALGLSVFTLYLLHHGRIQIVATGLSVGLWVLFTISAYTGDGVRGPAYVGNIVAIVITGLTISWRAGLVMTVLSTVTGLALAIADHNGLLPPLISYTPFTYMIPICVYFIIVFFVSKQAVEELMDSRNSLRQRERELQSLIDNSVDFIVRFDRQLRHVLVSPSLSKALNIPVEHFIGKTNQELGMSPESVEVWDREIHKVFETAQTNIIEFDYKTVEGLRHYQARLTPELNAKGDVQTILSIVRDITDLRKTQNDLEAQQRRLTLAMDVAKVGVYEHAVPLDKSTYHSASWAQILGYERDELPTHQQFLDWLYEQLHPDDRDEMFAVYNAFVSGERPDYVVEARIQHKSGQWRHVLGVSDAINRDASGNVLRIVGIMIDVSAIKQAEQARRISDERLRHLIRNVPVIVFELDKTGVFQMVQGKGFEQLGVKPDDLIGTSILTQFTDVVDDIGDKFQNALKGTESAHVQQIGERYYDIRYVPNFGESRNVIGVIGIATDITDRLEAERIRIELEQERELVALKERFIATASHDFRTPLTVIKMNTEFLQNYMDMVTPERRLSKLLQIQKQVDRMIGLLEDVLTVSKIHEGRVEFTPASVNLQRLCENVWDDIVTLANETHQLHFSYEATVQDIIADEHLLIQILVNLLSNAVKYTPQSGDVRFEVGNSNAAIRFQIRDSGIGIPEADQKRLFEPFHRAANARDIHGTGLGLVIVKEYVDMHGGNIEVQSEAGVGTTFTVRIPVHQS